MKPQRLFTPIKISNMELKNRVIMPALHHLYTPDGHATKRFNEYYWRRAEGGAALIFIGGARFDDLGAAFAMPSLQTDEFIPGWKEFTDGMHARGAKVGVQLYQGGRYVHSAAIPGGGPAVAPSAVFSKFTKEMPREITKDEIKQVIRDWAAGAVRAQKAGFDVVEILASAGYLITQFLSPVTNLRTDEYGGSWENRTRFAIEVVEAVRAAVGPDYPISMRIAGNDFVANSNTNEEAVEFCKLMEKAGASMFNVTGGWHESVIPQITGDLARGGYTYLAAAIRDAVSIPVAASNRINDPILAEKILATEEADMVSVGRPLIADPDWPNKAREGRIDEIRRCMACNQGCLARTFFGKPIECLVNGMAGREYLLEETKPSDSKRILVIGAGPAGCEFAIAASEHGHDVTIWEKSDRIGGQLPMVAAPPGKQEFNSLIGYYETMLAKCGVDVVLGKEADAKQVNAAGYDVVVTATGMIPNTIPLPGQPSVPVVTAYDILQQNTVAGRNVVIIGGGTVGCETAQYLAHEASLSPDQVYFLLEHQAETVEKVLRMMNTTRRNIVLVDIAKIGSGFDPGTGWPIMKDLKRLGVKQYPFSTVKAVDGNKITVSVPDKETKEIKDIVLECDTIVLSVGAKPNGVLYGELKELGANVYNLGDSEKIGKILDAVREADELAVRI